jgi:hypothetical protein
MIREINDGICQQGPCKIWRAYGVNDAGREFALIDLRYDVAYPLDASTEKQIRRLCAKQYAKHPVKTATRR